MRRASQTKNWLQIRLLRSEDERRYMYFELACQIRYMYTCTIDVTKTAAGASNVFRHTLCTGTCTCLTLFILPNVKTIALLYSAKKSIQHQWLPVLASHKRKAPVPHGVPKRGRSRNLMS